jgi:pimeloyl-ACP methyl ester carboxylesterase
MPSEGPPAEPSPPARRSRFIDVNASRVFVEEVGEGLPVVCVHGLGGGTHFFGALGAALASRRRVIALDLPGSGATPAAERFSFEHAAGLIVSLAAHEGWTGVCLLGHSMGTIVALEAIRRAPRLAAALVAVGGLPEPLDSARTRIAARVEAVKRSGLAGCGPAVVDANFSGRTRRERPELTSLYAKLFELQPVDAYVSTAEALVRWHAPPLPRLDDVACLAVTGDEDLYAPPDAVRRFTGSLPTGTRCVVMPACGHLPFLEQPAVFASVVDEFLSGLS